MSDPTDKVPPPVSPTPNAGRFGRPMPRVGAGRLDAVPRMENVRVTAPDLARRAAMEKTRARLVIATGGFCVLFGAVLAKLALATIVTPLAPHRAERPVAEIVANAVRSPIEATLPGQRATITDRNGQPMAISLNTVSLFADPRQIADPNEVAEKLKLVLPRLDLAETIDRLKRDKKFIYLAREITPREEQLVNNLGIPGVDFQPTQHRQYPLGRTAAQVLGGVDVDQSGFAGVEKYFDDRLRNDTEPLRLSIDLQVQAAVREELLTAMQTFGAIGGCGIVMDVRTGEVLAMVSLPDYDANSVRTAVGDDRFNRAVEGRYEPGSTFKLQTASMALDGGIVHIWDEFDASHNISIGRFTISDFEGKHRWLYLPEVLAYSSNLGAAHIALAVGADRQQAWLRSMGMFDRIPIELPEATRPIIQPAAKWKEIVTMTVGFGHGISITPLHVVRGTAAIANGGLLVQPTILALRPGQEPETVRVMQTSTSDIMRRLMRLVVTDGFGKSAEVPGYYPGGKTGTAEKVTAHGGYRKHANVAAFMSVFPMNAPRYAVYMMLDEPHGNKNTFGYATAGWVVAPAAGKVIARIGPMLGMLPDLEDMPAINQALAIPLQPMRPSGVTSRGPVVASTAADAAARPATVQNRFSQLQFGPNRPTEKAPLENGLAENRPSPVRPARNGPDLTVAPTVLPPAITRPTPDIRRNTTWQTRHPTAPVMAVSTVAAGVDR